MMVGLLVLVTMGASGPHQGGLACQGVLKTEASTGPRDIALRPGEVHWAYQDHTPLTLGGPLVYGRPGTGHIVESWDGGCVILQLGLLDMEP